MAKKRNEAAIIEGFVAQAANDITAYEIPSGGNFNEMRASLEILKAMRREKELLLERLSLTKKEIVHLEHRYKNANLEFEKMKYLQTQDFNVQMENIKKAETAALDEFATMKFARVKKE